MNKNLTVGKPETILWKFCLPLFGSIIFQQLYNIADSFVAGRFIGENALAAVGNSYEITLIFIGIAFGCNIGCSVIVSKLFGANNYRDLKTAIYTTLITCGILCIILMSMGFYFSGSLLQLIHTPDDLMEDSMVYLKVYCLSFPFVLYYNIATGIFSALGDSKTPFIFLAVSSISNIIMDILFVTAFHMGVSGVAWATFLCQGVSCIFAITFVFKRFKTIHTTGPIPLFSWRLLKQISIIAIPSILQQSFVSIGNIIIQGVINSFGSSVIAGYSASIKLNSLVITSLTTLGNGMSNYTAQNMGALKLNRIHSGFKAGIKLVWLLCIPLVLLYFGAGKWLVCIFLQDSTGIARQVGTEILKIFSPFYFVVSMKLIADGVLRGSNMMGKFMVTTFSDLILRVTLAIFLSRTALGATGIWLAWPVGWFIGTILSLLFYRTGVWFHQSNDKTPVTQKI